MQFKINAFLMPLNMRAAPRSKTHLRETSLSDNRVTEWRGCNRTTHYDSRKKIRFKRRIIVLGTTELKPVLHGKF
jgi:hypothetical protein